MPDQWKNFACQMGDKQAWISFNDSFAKIASMDPRRSRLRVMLQLKDPTDAGLSSNSEFPTLRLIEDAVNEAIEKRGGVQVGRITTNGRRYFEFYVEATKKSTLSDVRNAVERFDYEYELAFEDDPQKEGYWNEIYPTEDDWQVVRDLEVLGALTDRGDEASQERNVTHWIFSDDESKAHQFSAWAKSAGFSIDELSNSSERWTLRLTHRGTMLLSDITSRTIALSRSAREIGVEYDGWETSVEKCAADESTTS